MLCVCVPPAAARADAPIAFDFLINDELLVTSLEAFIVQRGISAVRVRRCAAARPQSSRRLLRPKASRVAACAPAPRAFAQESVLTVEYIPAVGPFEPEARAAPQALHTHARAQPTHLFR